METGTEKETLPRRVAPATGVAAIAAAIALLAAPAAAGAGRRHSGHRRHRGAAAGSHTLTVKDHARLHLLHADGNTLIEQGRATGTLPGTVRVKLTLRAHTATSSFTIHAKGGTIGGSGAGSLKIGRHGWDSFGGRLTVRHGSGRFRGVHGKGGLYGSVYRFNDSMKAQVYGTLHY